MYILSLLKLYQYICVCLISLYQYVYMYTYYYCITCVYQVYLLLLHQNECIYFLLLYPYLCVYKFINIDVYILIRWSISRVSNVYLNRHVWTAMSGYGTPGAAPYWWSWLATKTWWPSWSGRLRTRWPRHPMMGPVGCFLLTTTAEDFLYLCLIICWTFPLEFMKNYRIFVYYSLLFLFFTSSLSVCCCKCSRTSSNCHFLFMPGPLKTSSTLTFSLSIDRRLWMNCIVINNGWLIPVAIWVWPGSIAVYCHRRSSSALFDRTLISRCIRPCLGWSRPPLGRERWSSPAMPSDTLWWPPLSLLRYSCYRISRLGNSPLET